VPNHDTCLQDWKIFRDSYQWAEAERLRLSEVSSGEPSQPELFDRMRRAYERADGRSRAVECLVPAHYQALVAEFLRLLQDDSEKFRAFRQTVIGVLSDRMDAVAGHPGG